MYHPQPNLNVLGNNVLTFKSQRCENPDIWRFHFRTYVSGHFIYIYMYIYIAITTQQIRLSLA